LPNAPAERHQGQPPLDLDLGDAWIAGAIIGYGLQAAEYGAVNGSVGKGKR